jgi:single-stranded-DNA-specific exonuclease
MSIASKKWNIAQALDRAALAQYRDMSPVLAQVLYNRGFTKPVSATRFLYAKMTNDPLAPASSMKDVRRAAERLLTAIDRREKIAVYGDFDADGVTSTALMMQVLRGLGADVCAYIPHRVDEGYGLNTDALRTLAEQGVRVVMTVDCGIRSLQEVADSRALGLGLDILITDHHSVGPEVPDAYAVVNPKQRDCKYPEKMLAGVGVAYKVAGVLLRLKHIDKHNSTLEAWNIVKEKLEGLLDLVAIGTVADLAPLNSEENRALVRRGLEKINQADRPGVRALLEVAGIEPGKVTAMSIGYALGPRINAAGRLGSAMTAYQLLVTDDPHEAAQLAAELQKLNEERQQFTRDAQDMIRQQLEEESQTDATLIFASSPDFRPGIVGLVAGRLVEEFFRPAVVMEQGEDESRASCRSIPQFDITRALDQCADLLVRHGGHAQAAGFTVLNSNISDLIMRLTDLARRELDGQELLPTLDIDAEVSIHKSDDELKALYEELQLLEPTGHSNPAPVFMMLNAYILECRTVGKDGRHLKLKVQRAGRPPLDAIAFGLGEWAAHFPGHVDLAYQLDINEWNGRRTLQLNVQDIRLSESKNGSA